MRKVAAMGDCDDVVHPTDRKMHEILAHIAKTSPDPRVRYSAQDLQLTLPPIRDLLYQTLQLPSPVPKMT